MPFPRERPCCSHQRVAVKLLLPVDRRRGEALAPRKDRNSGLNSSQEQQKNKKTPTQTSNRRNLTNTQIGIQCVARTTTCGKTNHLSPREIKHKQPLPTESPATRISYGFSPRLVTFITEQKGTASKYYRARQGNTHILSI